MIKYTNITTKEQFQDHVVWSGETLEKIKAQFDHRQEWIIRDRFGNAWKVTFMGAVNQYKLENMEKDSYFEVDMLVYGDNIEIYHAYDHGKNYRADNKLRKYKELACMVSNYLRFGILK